MTHSLVPLLGGFGQHGPPWAGGPPPFHPFLGGLMFLLFLLVLGTAFFLVRRGSLGPPPWVRAGGRAFGGHAFGPEREARRILAERFARGEIDTDDFMERASVLNWTPGAEPETRPGKKRKSR